MIHIAFGASAAGNVKFVLRELGLEQKERVISFWDMFSVGPVWQLHEEKGVQARFKWMKECMSDEYGEYMDYQNSFKKTIRQLSSIQEGSHIVVWCSENAHEQTGIRYVIHLLKEKNIDITLINMTEAYEELFRTKKRAYTPLHTGEIAPEKLQGIYGQDFGKVLTDHEREDLEEEWLLLSEGQDTVRIWRNGRIQVIPEDYYDEFIVKKAKKLHREQSKKDYMKSARLIGEVIGHLDQYIGDEFIEYRLRKLIEKAVFEVKGNLEAMRYYEIKLV